MITIFTDGSYTKSNNRAGYGVHFVNKEYKDISCEFKIAPITNQRAELYAIYKALETCKNDTKDITIYSDSKYSIDSATKWIKAWKKNGWKTTNGKPVKNVDIIVDIDNLISSYKHKITLRHVLAHTNKQDKLSICNAIADKLASGYSK